MHAYRVISKCAQLNIKCNTNATKVECFIICFKTLLIKVSIYHVLNKPRQLNKVTETPREKKKLGKIQTLRGNVDSKAFVVAFSSSVECCSRP